MSERRGSTFTTPAATAGTAVLPGPDLSPEKTGQAPLKVLVIEDEAAERENLTLAVRMLGCRVDTAENVAEAWAKVQAERYDLVFCDLMLGDGTGLDLLPRLLAAHADVQVVVLTAFASFATAVQAVKAGATNYLQKPCAPAHIAKIIEQALEDRRLAQNYIEIERSAQNGLEDVKPISRAPAMQQIWSVVERAAKADVPLLLRGESGTGKGMLARALHRQSERAPEPFVTINCPSLSDELLMSDLFGHVKGAFTGAHRDQIGKIEAADGGTVFLDEMGDLSATVQAKLLRFLQDHTYERLGTTNQRLADVRIIAATNRDLEAMVREGRFREDLLYRLNVVELTLPALRDRKEDILDLSRHFLAVYSAAANRTQPELSAEAQALLMAHPWPGNIRELRNEIQRACVLWPTRVIGPEAFSSRVYRDRNRGPLLGEKHSLEEIESEHIRMVLAKTATFEEAATVLGIEPSTLWRKRRSLGI